ncbi:MAG: FAD-dependent oxidoreductase, partial [Euryarchaeota archaeon]|nr:FAD-dependent oxidoreductase [Euryarchaeota archaeon]
MGLPRTEVLVIGGGVTGAGVARDLALRGIGVTLIEKGDFSAGATGRCHGMLHSGGRYAVKDPESAAECAAEGAILRKIADFCVEDTGGLFVGVDGDDPAFVDRFMKGCGRTGVAAKEITLREAFLREPLLSAKAVSAVEVPDASIDPFALTIGNIQSARAAGAKAFNYRPVRKIRMKEGRADEVIVEDLRNGSTGVLRPEIVV